MQLRRSEAMVIMDNRQLQAQTAALFGTKTPFCNPPNVSHAQLLPLCGVEFILNYSPLCHVELSFYITLKVDFLFL